MIRTQPMRREKWERIEKLYHAALECRPEIRKTFLQDACEDEDLRREVESLLAVDEVAVPLFDSPPWETKPKIGQCFGPFELIAPIGSGGMGEVWKARDTRLKRLVALKFSKAGFSDRFEAEAHAIAALNHPHICQIYDVGPGYLAMEFVEGQPLRGPMPLDQVMRLAVQLAEALDAAHRKGIVHRDFKPDNILLTKSGVKVLDFGLAKLHPVLLSEDQPLNRGVTQNGVIVGTLQYMAPEQLQGKQADARSDIFSFGCVLYEMVTGKHAYDSPSTAGRLAAVLEGPAPSIAHLAPVNLDKLLSKCLEKDPEERWQNAGDVKAAITLVFPPASSQSTSRRAWLTGTLGAAVGIAGSAVAIRSSRPLRERSLRVEVVPPAGSQFVIAMSPTFALSPDGRSLAHIAWLRGKKALWVRPLDGTPRVIVETTHNATVNPFWSPDGKTVAFYDSGKLQRVDATGGTPWTVCEGPPNFTGGTWTWDGRILCGSSDGLFQVPASGGPPRRLTETNRFSGERDHSLPQVLPKGLFLYVAGNDRPENSAVYVAPLARPAERICLIKTSSPVLYASAGDGTSYLLSRSEGGIVARKFDLGSMKLTGENHRIISSVRSGYGGRMLAAASSEGSLIYSASVSASNRLEWFSREGKSLVQIGEAAAYDTFRLSPHGERIVVTRTEPNSSHSVWMLDSPRGNAVRFGPNDSSTACWSPDSRSVIFSAGTSPNLFRQSVEGTQAAERLTASQNLQLPNDWSRDGQFVLYQELVPGRGFDLMVLKLSADGKPLSTRAWLSSSVNETDARFSPEIHPRWVAYHSIESAQYEVFIDSFPERKRKFRISTDGGRFPQWRADGRELFFQSLDHKLMSVEVKLGMDLIETSSPRELFPLPITDNRLLPYEAAADGQRFLVRAAEQQAEPLTLITNWPELMRRGPV